ncbi:MAG: hypothetical protein JWQ07_132 [Ramlibacter sp.]|nr:hypothetical protein [Ramlibacter sp.]
MGAMNEFSKSQDVRNEVAVALFRIENHPFVIRAHQGELTKAESLRWVKCAGRESRTFPKILENMLKDCRDEKIRSILQANLDDEHGNGNPDHAHFQHYLHLLDKIGVPRGEFEAYPEQAGIRLAVELALSISANGNLARALGYMLVNEGMTPITYSAIKLGMLRYFPELRTQFFDMHITVDEKHVAELYRAIDELPASSMAEVAFGVMVGERGMAVLLDEVVGIFDTQVQA